MTVFVCKEPLDENYPFLAVNAEAACEAIENLSEDAYRLWCYFANNPKGRSFVLTLDDLAERRFTESSFYESMDELTKLGYIRDLGRDVFIFYENPNSNF